MKSPQSSRRRHGRVDRVGSADLHVRTRPDTHRATYCSRRIPSRSRFVNAKLCAYMRAEVIENPKEIPIEIDSHELMQAQGFGSGADINLAGWRSTLEVARRTSSTLSRFRQSTRVPLPNSLRASSSARTSRVASRYPGQPDLLTTQSRPKPKWFRYVRDGVVISLTGTSGTGAGNSCHAGLLSSSFYLRRSPDRVTSSLRWISRLHVSSPTSCRTGRQDERLRSADFLLSRS